MSAKGGRSMPSRWRRVLEAARVEGDSKMEQFAGNVELYFWVQDP